MGAPAPPERPGTVLAAAIMTYIGSGLMILLGLLFLIGSSIAGFRQGVAEGAGMVSVPAGVLVVGGIFLAFIGTGLVVLAVFAQRGRNGARIALTVIGGVFLVMQLLSMVTAGAQGVIGFVWICVAITLFWNAAANAWYRQVRH